MLRQIFNQKQECGIRMMKWIVLKIQLFIYLKYAIFVRFNVNVAIKLYIILFLKFIAIFRKVVTNKK